MPQVSFIGVLFIVIGIICAVLGLAGAGIGGLDPVRWVALGAIFIGIGAIFT